MRRGRGRGLDELLSDLFLLLYLIVDAYERGKAIKEETRLQKLVFLAEREMLVRRVKAFDYNFIRLTFGPYSDELRRDLARLLECGLIYDDPGKGLIPTEKGLRLIEKMRDVIDKYGEVVEIIHKMNEEYAGMPLEKLLEHVYNLRRPLKGPKVAIKEVKIRTPLLRRISEDRAKVIFRIPGDRMKVLEAYFDPEVEEVLHEKVKGFEVLLLRYKGERGYTVIVPKLEIVFPNSKGKRK